MCYSALCVCLCRWCVESGQLDESSLVQTATSELSSEDQELLKAYHHSFDDEKVDLDLILHLLFNICQSSDEGETVSSMKRSHLQQTLQFSSDCFSSSGAVLIFLPGYDEIVSLRDRIVFDDERFSDRQQRSVSVCSVCPLPAPAQYSAGNHEGT